MVYPDVCMLILFITRSRRKILIKEIKCSTLNSKLHWSLNHKLAKEGYKWCERKSIIWCFLSLMEWNAEDNWMEMEFVERIRSSLSCNRKSNWCSDLTINVHDSQTDKASRGLVRGLFAGPCIKQRVGGFKKKLWKV